MPVISRFLGIIIAMYWDDHAPHLIFMQNTPNMKLQ